MTSSSEIATAIGERYELLEQIGSGGFANVFRGRQVATGQPVAIKVLRIDRGEGAPDPAEQIARFRQETRLCAQLQHPNIVPLLDAAETSGGQVCAVFSYVPGWNLDDVLAAEGALEPAEALHLMTEVIDAISSAHARGIIHRDLKPGNVMVCATGARRNALVMDFGLGTLVGDRLRRNQRNLTVAGTYLGTPFYSSPEQIRGEAPTPRTDLYSWGLVVLECLTGESALGARTPHEAIHRHLGPDPVPIPDALASHELGRLLRRVTEKDVEARRISAAEALEVMLRCARGALPERAELQSFVPESERPGAAARSRRSRELSPMFLVPLARNPNFTGRDELLRQVGQQLESSRLLAVVALEGMGGIGKSQAALEYAYRNAQLYQLVAWIRAERPETLAQDYCAIGAPLALPETPDQAHRIEAVRSWLERNDRWLLIFDNATEPAALRAFLPRSHSGHVLVTSRHTSWRGLAASLEVNVLAPQDAAAFLSARTGEDDAAAARELCEELGGLPLALEDAAAYMESTGRSIAAYLSHLRKHRQRLLFGAPDPGRISGTLGTVWELSFRQVEREAPSAAELLSITGFLAPDDVPLELFRAGADHLPAELAKTVRDELAFDAAIAALRRYSLVRVEGDHLAIHRLIQLAARERLSDAEHQRWTRIALRMLEAAYPRGALAGEYRPAAGRLLSHALSVLAHAPQDEESQQVSARLLRRTGIYRSARAEQDLAAHDLEKALALFESAREPDTAQVAGVLWELSMVLYAVGEVQAARAQIDRCVGLVESSEGARSMRLVPALITHSWVRRSQGELAASLSAAEQALAILEASLGPEHPFDATALVMVVRGLWNANRVPEARAAAERALALLAEEQMHPMATGTLYNLAHALLELGDPRRARSTAERGLALSEKAYGPHHPFVLTNAAVVGAASLQLGDLPRARECLERAWTMGQRLGRQLHEDYTIARSDLGLLLLAGGELAAAREVLEQAQAATAQVCGDTWRAQLCAQLALGEFQLAVGDLAQARRHCEQGIAAIERQLGAAHPVRMRGHLLEARILRRAGEGEAALRQLEAARHVADAAQLGAHPLLAEVFEMLGALHEERGAPDLAREHFARARDLYAHCFGAAHAACLRMAARCPAERTPA